MLSPKANQLAAEEALKSIDRKFVNDTIRSHQDNLCNLNYNLKKRMVRLLDVRAIQDFHRTKEAADALKNRRTGFQYAVEQYNYAKENYLEVLKKLMKDYPQTRDDWNDLIYNCPTVTEILETAYGLYRRGKI